MKFALPLVVLVVTVCSYSNGSPADMARSLSMDLSGQVDRSAFTADRSITEEERKKLTGEYSEDSFTFN